MYFIMQCDSFPLMLQCNSVGIVTIQVDLPKSKSTLSLQMSQCISYPKVSNVTPSRNVSM